MTKINLLDNIGDEKDLWTKIQIWYLDTSSASILSLVFLIIIIIWAILSFFGGTKEPEEVQNTKYIDDVVKEVILENHEGFFENVFGRKETGKPLKSLLSQKRICYEHGYYEYDSGYCKRMVNGTSEVININELR